jgi:Rad52/22 family double-strand break repair protein
MPTEQEKRIQVEALTKALAAPFAAAEVKFKPAVVSGNRAMALAYVDARVIQDRLDEVLGVDGWQDDYECRDDGSVVCRLRLRLGEEWVTKVDVGGPSEQPDGGDRLKAAFSDALKRAAVKFGIGRYLYRLPAQWVDYDTKKRQFVRPPTVPGSALPPPKSTPRPAPSGEDFVRRLQDYERKLASQGLCARGDLLRHVTDIGVKAGHAADLKTWNTAAIALAAEATRKFEADLRKRTPQQRKDVA